MKLSIHLGNIRNAHNTAFFIVQLDLFICVCVNSQVHGFKFTRINMLLYLGVFLHLHNNYDIKSF